MQNLSIFIDVIHKDQINQTQIEFHFILLYLKGDFPNFHIKILLPLSHITIHEEVKTTLGERKTNNEKPSIRN